MERCKLVKHGGVVKEIKDFIVLRKGSTLIINVSFEGSRTQYRTTTIDIMFEGLFKGSTYSFNIINNNIFFRDVIKNILNEFILFDGPKYQVVLKLN